MEKQRKTKRKGLLVGCNHSSSLCYVRQYRVDHDRNPFQRHCRKYRQDVEEDKQYILDKR